MKYTHVRALLHLPILAYGKLKLIRKYRIFKKVFLILPEWESVNIRLNGDSTTSAVEPFTHYDAFYYWIGRDIAQKTNQKILDVGGKKLINGWLSVMNQVISVNLTIPVDQISNVEYVASDVTKKLPFIDQNFDIFISPVSLNLIGLGRYGDDIDAKAIPNFVSELSRCMKENSVMYISVVLGKDQVIFNHHFVLSFPTITKLFSSWVIEEFLIDNQVSIQETNVGRFTDCHGVQFRKNHISKTNAIVGM